MKSYLKGEPTLVVEFTLEEAKRFLHDAKLGAQQSFSSIAGTGIDGHPRSELLEVLDRFTSTHQECR